MRRLKQNRIARQFCKGGSGKGGKGGGGGGGGGGESATDRLRAENRETGGYAERTARTNRRVARTTEDRLYDGFTIRRETDIARRRPFNRGNRT